MAPNGSTTIREAALHRILDEAEESQPSTKGIGSSKSLSAIRRSNEIPGNFVEGIRKTMDNLYIHRSSMYTMNIQWGLAVVSVGFHLKKPVRFGAEKRLCAPCPSHSTRGFGCAAPNCERFFCLGHEEKWDGLRQDRYEHNMFASQLLNYSIIYDIRMLISWIS